MLNIIINANQNILPQQKYKILTNQDNFWLNLLVCLGFDQEFTPLATLLKRYHNLDGDWVIISPIRWQATHNDAMIVAYGNDLEFDAITAKLWFHEISDFLAIENIKLFYHNELLWLANIDQLPTILSKNIQHLYYKPLSKILLQLDQTLYWQKLLTELQMYLTNHDFNKQSMNNKNIINGVWFWGNGILDINNHAPLICDDPKIKQIFVNCELLDHIKKIKNNDFFIISQITNDILAQLAQYKNIKNWYWNNIAYQTTKSNYLNNILNRLKQ